MTGSVRRAFGARRRGTLLALRAGRLRHYLREVAHAHRFLERPRFDRVLDHGHAERASHGDAFGLGFAQLVEAILVDARAFVFFLPEASAARAAAEGSVLRLIDFGHLGARDGAKRLARAVPLAVVPRHVAGIVIGDARAQNLLRL